jgi:hypothetical protein
MYIYIFIYTWYIYIYVYIYLYLFIYIFQVEEGSWVLVTPPANRGKPLMVMILKSPTTSVLQIEFQRQKYLYTPSTKLGANGKDFPNGVFSLSQCPMDLALSHYTQANGMCICIYINIYIYIYVYSPYLNCP